MKFIETALKGTFVIEPDRLEDERGFFARVFCEQDFAERGLETHFLQCSISFNHRTGTLRGMHYQSPPHEETKIVRCTRGKIYDVVVDMRRDSGSHRKWISIELSAESRQALYIPKGLAHGFQTLEDRSEVFYQISQVYVPQASKTVRWNDPAFGISWPLTPTIMSKVDANADYQTEH